MPVVIPATATATATAVLVGMILFGYATDGL
jgi:hypothetical protein